MTGSQRVIFLRGGCKVKPRAKVRPEFIDLVCETAKEKPLDIHEQSKSYANRVSYLRSKGEMIRRLSALVRGDEIAIDRLKTRLRGLNYQSLNAYDRDGTKYFVGKTNAVPIEQYARSTSTKPQAYYDASPYWIYVRADHFLAENVDSIQSIPERDPKTLTRHPHIVAYNTENHSSPLDYNPSICWSGFAMLVSAAAEDHDIVALFRYTYLHLSRWAVGSEWGTARRIPFIINHPMEYPHAH
jgi:hypothetical protein